MNLDLFEMVSTKYLQIIYMYKQDLLIKLIK